MQPLYKGDGKDREDRASYRGIFLSNAMLKLFEVILESRLQGFTEKFDTLRPRSRGRVRAGSDTMRYIAFWLRSNSKNSHRRSPCRELLRRWGPHTAVLWTSQQRTRQFTEKSCK